MSNHLKKYCDYITNTGGNPTIEQFDEDWSPIGPEAESAVSAIN